MSENITTVKYDTSDGKNVLRLCGRIDSSNAEASEKLMLSLLPSPVPDTLVIDASDLEYISSAGLRILMRLRKQTNKKLPITETAQPIYEIFEVTGFTELFDISKKMRRISVDGCEIIGRGFYGTVYRIDEETIVKVYKSADSLSMIQNEKRLARLALIAGVPTAISYDIVRVGDSYGSVFELLRAKNFNDLLGFFHCGVEIMDLRIHSPDPDPDLKLIILIRRFEGFHDLGADSIDRDIGLWNQEVAVGFRIPFQIRMLEVMTEHGVCTFHPLTVMDPARNFYRSRQFRDHTNPDPLMGNCKIETNRLRPHQEKRLIRVEIPMNNVL